MRLNVPDAPRYLVVGAGKPLSHDVLAAHRVLAAQVSLAEDSAAAHRLLVHQANHDQLTGLPNRTALYRLLADEIDGPDAGGGAAVLHLDLDDFKIVNDTFGHTAGDELLVEVARRLRAVAGRTGTAARIGGDEFVLVLPDAADPAIATRVAERLIAALDEPVRLRETTVPVRASVGIAHAAPGLTAGDVVRCADIAMYTAKGEGKHRVEHFDPAPSTGGSHACARSVLLVGQTLGLETIAEGVELSEQATALETAGVQIAQGFLFARPMAGDEFPAWAATAEPVATT